MIAFFLLGINTVICLIVEHEKQQNGKTKLSGCGVQKIRTTTPLKLPENMSFSGPTNLQFTR